MDDAGKQKIRMALIARMRERGVSNSGDVAALVEDALEVLEEHLSPGASGVKKTVGSGIGRVVSIRGVGGGDVVSDPNEPGTRSIRRVGDKGGGIPGSGGASRGGSPMGLAAAAAQSAMDAEEALEAAASLEAAADAEDRRMMGVMNALNNKTTPQLR